MLLCYIARFVTGYVFVRCGAGTKTEQLGLEMNSKVKRNANGAGSFSRRENSWIYTISIGKDNQGKYRRKSFGAKTQKEAKEKADRYLKNCFRGSIRTWKAIFRPQTRSAGRNATAVR